ncbi:hypothetical protein [Halarsenatibacter silvermanii]|uniref:Uncharacterized protein n=1 Tax=Halarsenatibacter silvermanii TaxID=321763 RepID=A0A1G9IW12_9FIRM|nr:hypothetical protein [Halarsenatibacter silvermanii]SDL29448.1 hypothetical protein SAMN04488692_10379 [Halarsenatibacter silvermanii]
MAEPAAVGIHAVRRANFQVGDKAPVDEASSGRMEVVLEHDREDWYSDLNDH